MSRAAITTASEANRRRARRTPVSGQTKIQCRKGHLGLGPNLTVKILDLSETGACLILKAPLEPGEEAELLLSGPSIPRPLECRAQVIWSVALADGCHGVGVNFVRPLHAADRLRLGKV